MSLNDVYLKLFDKYRIPDIGLILLMGLTSLLWFKPGYDLITGGDMDFPLNPAERISRRLYVWHPQILGGTDRSMDVTGFFFYGLIDFFYNLGFKLITVQKLTFVFWLTLTGLSMYFLASQILNNNSIKNSIKIRVICLTSAVFYVFNFYQVYAWEIFKIGEISGVVLIPLLLGVYIKGLDKQISLAKAALLVSIFSIVGSGIGVQPPMYGVLIIILSSYFIYFNLINKGKNFVYNLKFSIYILILFILTNAFWIIPVVNFIINSGYISASSATEVFSSIYLLEYTSQYNSILNVLRQFGQTFWFDTWGGVPYTPYFKNYTNNMVLMAASFMVPILAICTLILYKKNRFVLFFSFLLILGIFLSKGIHPPFENIFKYLFLEVPGFWIYRAPWQKFGILIVISYAFLVGMACGKIYEFIAEAYHNKNASQHFALFIISLFIISNIVYMEPFVFGKMFPDRADSDYGFHQKFGLGFHQNFPKYISNATNWLNSNNEEFKVFLLPDDRTNVYNWGYGAAGDISLQLLNKGVIFRQYGEGTAPPHPIEKMQQLFVNSLYKNLTSDASKILTLLNVRYIIQRNDIAYNFYGDTDSPQFIKSRIEQQKGINLERTFDKWDIYNNDDILPIIYTTSDSIILNGDIYSLIPILPLYNFHENEALFFSDNSNIQNVSDLKLNKTFLNFTTLKNVNLLVKDGRKEPINWNMLSQDSYESRYYSGTKGVISVTGYGDPDMLIFPSIKESPYKFPSQDLTYWTASDSTLVYFKTGLNQTRIDSIYSDGKPANDIVGVWWENDWVGMNTNSIYYPIIIPPNQKVIIQINHKAQNITLKTVLIEKITPNFVNNSINSLNGISSDAFKNKPTVTFKKINPIKYTVHINSSKPFLLVFSENYHPQWNAYLSNDVNWFETFWKRPIDEKNHFIVNGYANAWYIENQGIYDITLYFLPQRLFYIGSIITLATLFFCVSYFIWKRKINNNTFRENM